MRKRAVSQANKAASPSDVKMRRGDTFGNFEAKREYLTLCEWKREPRRTPSNASGRRLHDEALVGNLASLAHRQPELDTFVTDLGVNDTLTGGDFIELSDGGGIMSFNRKVQYDVLRVKVLPEFL